MRVSLPKLLMIAAAMVVTASASAAGIGQVEYLTAHAAMAMLEYNECSFMHPPAC